jgi:hypothetical protein
MTKVFLSHSWEKTDMEISERMNDLLKKDGARTWMDDEKTRGGDNLPDEICNALDWCEVLVMVWSEAASKSRWVKAEWTSVFNEKRIVPCCLDKTKLPRLLKNNLYIDFRDFGNGYRRLLKALGLVTQVERVYVDEGVKVEIEEPRSNEIFCESSTEGVEISINGNAKVIDAFGLDVRFDPSVLHFSKVERGELTKNWIVGGNMVKPGILKIGGFAGSGRSVKDGSEGSIVFIRFKGFRKGQEKEISIENFTDDLVGMRFIPAAVDSMKSVSEQDKKILQKLKQPLKEFNQMNRFPDSYRAPKCRDLASMIEIEAERLEAPELRELKEKLLEYARRKEQIDQNTPLKTLMELFQRRVVQDKYEPFVLCEEIDTALKATSVSS